MKTPIKLLVLSLALALSASLLAQQDGPPPRGPGRPGGQGGQAGPGGPGGFHLVPPRAAEQLNLTADQQKKIADLEAETKAKLEKILTPEQLQQLKEMRPPQRPGGTDGPGGKGQGRGPGAPGGNEGGKRPQRPGTE